MVYVYCPFADATYIQGLVVQEATYGAAETELEDPDERLLLDVTIPVQALVRRSQLYIPGGDSKVMLEPFITFLNVCFVD